MQELGNDYEHCLEIIKKLDGTAGKNLKLDDSSIKEIDELAEKLSTLASAGPETQQEIKDKRALLDSKWASLQDGLVKYRLGINLSINRSELLTSFVFDHNLVTHSFILLIEKPWTRLWNATPSTGIQTT